MKSGKNYSKYDFSHILQARRKKLFRSCSKLAEAMLPPVESYGESETAQDLHAKAVETMRKKIERWESGKGEPSVSEFWQLCNLLECDPEYLWGVCSTPRRETKNIIDLTGFSENTADKLLDLKKDLDVSGSLSLSADYIEGLDVLFQNGDNFMQCLSEISRLNQLVNEYKNTKEALSTYKPDEFFEYPECDEMFMSLVKIYSENVNDVRLTTYHCTAAFSYIVRDLSKDVPIDSKI